MNILEEMDEKLREVCCIGDADTARKLIHDGAKVNSQNKINGWTPLHWACKRNHVNIVELLLEHFCDTNILNHKNERPIDITTNKDIQALLQNGENFVNKNETTFKPIVENGHSFVPNYLANPSFFYAGEKSHKNDIKIEKPAATMSVIDKELVLKMRVADSEDPDFIEVEILKSNLTYDILMALCCREFSLKKEFVERIRKLPNTRLRNDKDVKRLTQFQEIEVVVRKYIF